MAHRIDPLFADAWTEQFGASIDQTRILIDFVENLGVEVGKAVIAVPRSRFHDIQVARLALDDTTAQVLIDRLTFATRSSWRDIPDGFDDKDRQPWRYRRRLSMLRRPLLQIDGLADPTILVAPAMVRDAFAYMLSNYYRGVWIGVEKGPR